jgi:hypothetical protein
MPIDRTVLQYFIISVLAVLDQFFQADVFAYDVTGAVEQQQCQQTAYAAVAVIERVNTEKIQNEHGYEQKRVILVYFYALYK